MILQLAEEESVGPISAVHSHRYCARKPALSEHAHNFHLMDILNHCGNCCHEVDLWGIQILMRWRACILTVFFSEEKLLFFQIIIPDSKLWIRNYIYIRLQKILRTPLFYIIFEPNDNPSLENPWNHQIIWENCETLFTEKLRFCIIHFWRERFVARYSCKDLVLFPILNSSSIPTRYRHRWGL